MESSNLDLASLQKQLKTQKQRNSGLLHQLDIMRSESQDQLLHLTNQYEKKMQFLSQTSIDTSQTTPSEVIPLFDSGLASFSATDPLRFVTSKKAVHEKFELPPKKPRKSPKRSRLQNDTTSISASESRDVLDLHTSPSEIQLQKPWQRQSPIDTMTTTKPLFDVFLHDLQEAPTPKLVTEKTQAQLEAHFLGAQIEKLRLDLKRERQTSLGHKYRADVYLKKYRQLDAQNEALRGELFSQAETAEIAHRETERQLEIEGLQSELALAREELEIAKTDNEQNFDVQADLRQQLGKLKYEVFASQKQARKFRDLRDQGHIQYQKSEVQRRESLREYAQLQRRAGASKGVSRVVEFGVQVCQVGSDFGVQTVSLGGGSVCRPVVREVVECDQSDKRQKIQNLEKAVLSKICDARQMLVHFNQLQREQAITIPNRIRQNTELPACQNVIKLLCQFSAEQKQQFFKVVSPVDIIDHLNSRSEYHLQLQLVFPEILVSNIIINLQTGWCQDLELFTRNSLFIKYDNEIQFFCVNSQRDLQFSTIQYQSDESDTVFQIWIMTQLFFILVGGKVVQETDTLIYYMLNNVKIIVI
ncbi:hypothetical protein SS50377_28304 [Spironucleus salmonicida]|uniref:Uncharacterized protein n=1 Tax=Spironucleus salmonicida TaxID=348837 RepID=V6LQC4_9EUKA|nr:hypothetical protein SS50377_28304 [Spironucleus salmonicida]|eukprot:EST46785.1 Hypothetical protein SS50377_13185 [Spironucleus salmonicida]